MATDGVRYSDFSPLPADQLAGDENFVGLKNGVNVRLEGDWRGPMADLLRPYFGLGNLASVNGSTVGLEFAQLPTPGDASWARVNSDGTVSLRTAAQTLSDLGASSGDGNQVVTSPTDVTSGRVTDVGWMGLGVPIELTSSDNVQELQYRGGVTTANFFLLFSSLPSGLPSGFSGSAILREYQNYANSGFLELIQFNTGLVFKNVKVGGVWQGWQEVGSGGSGGGGGTNTEAERTFTSADEVSSNISVGLDASEYSEWQLDFNGSPLPSTSGAYNINIANLPDSIDNVQFFHIRMKRAGRKTVNLTATNESSTSLTVSWLEAPEFLATSGAWDMVTLHRWPSNPNILFASLNDGRT